MTLQRAAQLALEAQDACNLSGLLASYKEIVHTVLWEEARRIGQGTAWVNQHPINVLFLDKLASLARCQCLCSESTAMVSLATDTVEKLAKGEQVEWNAAA